MKKRSITPYPGTRDTIPCGPPDVLVDILPYADSPIDPGSLGEATIEFFGGDALLDDEE